MCNSDSNFQKSIAPLFVTEIASVGICFLSCSNRNILVPKLFDFADVLFARLPLKLPFGFESRMWDLIVSVPDHCISFYFACSNREETFLKLFGDIV